MLYEELLSFSKNRLKDFFKNVTLFENQFEYSDFNKKCYDCMFLYNNQEKPKTVKELKAEVFEQELSKMFFNSATLSGGLLSLKATNKKSFLNDLVQSLTSGYFSVIDTLLD